MATKCPASPVQPPVTGPPESSHGLHPAQDLLNPFPNPLADRVPSMPGGPAINSAGPPLVVLRDLRRYPAPPQVATQSRVS